MNLSSSLEDYLEAIHNIMEKEGKVRITDISLLLKVEKPSVNMAIKKLKNLNLVIHERYGDIGLTNEGEKEALRIIAKHKVLVNFLHNILGLTEKEAERDACKIEHTISTKTYTRLSIFIDLIEESDLLNNGNWKNIFNKYIENNPDIL